MAKAIRYTLLKGQWTTGIYDYQYFSSRLIDSGEAQPWKTDARYGKLSMSASRMDYMKNLKTVAFLLSQDGQLVFETYFKDHEAHSISNSFSMAKSVVTLLLGCAIEDGYIEGLDQKVSDFFPQYRSGNGHELTVGDLARMSSGMDWQESYYLPINVTTEAYYGDNISNLITSRRIREKPGESFEYLSGNTQLLAMVLDQALPISLSEYLSNKLWQPMGMEEAGQWMIDDVTGIERAYCCINACGRDFLKLGQLLLQRGEWKGKQLIDAGFIDLMAKPYFEDSPQYGYGLWMDEKYKYPFYMMRGHLGQYVIVIPSHNVVITRLGKRKSKIKVVERDMTEDIYEYIDTAMEMLGL
ncbi:serine hydrolase domain-containing protein [Membranihabitans marinus]|uniref:serine hydrolase domain-containing protein n=1 Tax=Membranihabitans marinus TaxID=1227546 RepID=UPI001F441890|nr:serine hydrolase [Membranihabitans marinus]